MNEGITLFLVLLGCSDDLSQCRRIEAEPQTYVSATACIGAQDGALLTRAAQAADYPTVVADCLTARQFAAIRDATVDLNRAHPFGEAR